MDGLSEGVNVFFLLFAVSLQHVLRAPQQRSCNLVACHTRGLCDKNVQGVTHVVAIALYCCQLTLVFVSVLPQQLPSCQNRVLLSS